MIDSIVTALTAGKSTKGGILTGFLSALIPCITFFVLYFQFFEDI